MPCSPLGHVDSGLGMKNFLSSSVGVWGRGREGSQRCAGAARLPAALSAVCFPTESIMTTPPPASEMPQPQPQALHYALANAQQVQIHQIGEDGQVQVVCTLLPE